MPQLRKVGDKIQLIPPSERRQVGDINAAWSGVVGKEYSISRVFTYRGVTLYNIKGISCSWVEEWIVGNVNPIIIGGE